MSDGTGSRPMYTPFTPNQRQSAGAGGEGSYGRVTGSQALCMQTKAVKLFVFASIEMAGEDQPSDSGPVGS